VGFPYHLPQRRAEEDATRRPQLPSPLPTWRRHRSSFAVAVQAHSTHRVHQHHLNAPTMISTRIAARRPLFQCLNAPIRSRNASHQARNDVDAILRQAQGRPGARPGRGLNPELDTISAHRENLMEIARLKRKRNWLALGAALSMIAPIFLVKMWDIPDLEKDQKAMEEADGTQKSRGIIDMVVGPPTKTDGPRKAAEEFQGKKVVIAAGDKVIAAPADSEPQTPTQSSSSRPAHPTSPTSHAPSACPTPPPSVPRASAATPSTSCSASASARSPSYASRSTSSACTSSPQTWPSCRTT
jgi:hypothetical protein